MSPEQLLHTELHITEILLQVADNKPRNSAQLFYQHNAISKFGQDFCVK
jgi:hypothetical protein